MDERSKYFQKAKLNARQLNKAIEEEAKRIQTIKGKEQTVLEAAPVWAPDSLADECPFCKEKFTFYFRRHHCRYADPIFCSYS